MKEVLKIIAFTTLFFLFVPASRSQEISSLLTDFTDISDNCVGYTQPLGDVLGASLNTGMFHSAFMPKNKFNLNFSLLATAAFIPEKSKTYTAHSTFTGNDVVTSTILGSPEGAVDKKENGLEYCFPGGAEMTAFPLAMPQLTMGSLFGTNINARFFAYDLASQFGNLGNQLGKINYYSIGGSHSLSQYFKYIKWTQKIPVDVALGFYYSNFKVGNLLNSKSGIETLQLSYQIPHFTFYGGLSYEMSTTNIYFEDEDAVFVADLDAQNKLRLITGVTCNLGVFRINVDYNLSRFSVLQAGIGIGINDTKPKPEAEETKIIN